MDEDIKEKMYNILKEFAEHPVDEEMITELAKRIESEMEKKHGGENKKKH